MLNNDNNKKYALLAALMMISLLAFVSCCKQMQKENIEGSAHDIAFRIYSMAGKDAAFAPEERISAENLYILGISEQVFHNDVEEATALYSSELAMGNALCVIVAHNEEKAQKLYKDMCEEYDWAPCDPAESIGLMLCGRYIVTAKDDRETTAKLCNAFSNMTHGEAFVKLYQNPMRALAPMVYDRKI